MSEHLEQRSGPARLSRFRGTTVRSGRGSNLTMALQTQWAQPQATAVLANGAQMQRSPQSQIGPQAQTFSLGGQAPVWSQVQALVWSMAVI